MILFPAIDLKDGRCVRLKLGDMASATVYNEDPAAQAKAFEDQGFEWLHVVDLDGAVEGRSVHGAAGDTILKATAQSARWRRSRAGWIRGSRASSSAPSRYAIPVW